MSKHGGNRNFGYGKQLSYAGHNALRTIYQGHFSTVAAHSSRWNHFAQWCKGGGIRDSRNITRETLGAFGRALHAQVLAGTMSVRYAQNLVSTANTVLAALRGDQSVRLSPSEAVGTRTHVRCSEPSVIDKDRLTPATEELQAAGHDRAAAVLELAREFGVRLKEASLLDLKEALRQATSRGAINIREGTKGGRGKEVDRWVPASSNGIAVLHRAIAAAGMSKNLIPPNWTFNRFNDHVHNVALPVLEKLGLGTIHDLRAAYACERYRQLTGRPAPVERGMRQAPKALDQAARDTISQELGHGRRDVAAAYLGSAR